MRVPLAIVVGLLGGCASTPQLEPPQISIAGVQVVSGELWTQHLKLRMHVHNPNDVALAVKGFDYSVQIAGEELGRGSCAQSFVLPPRGDAELTTSLTTNLAAALPKLLKSGPTAVAQDLPYRLTGKFALSQGLGRSIPFDEHGSFKP